MNGSVSAHLDCFPADYMERAVPVDAETKKVKFYTLSLEDLIISKLCAGRGGKDDADIGTEQVLRDINWEALDALAKEIPQFLLNDRKADEFKSAYDGYVRRYRK